MKITDFLRELATAAALLILGSTAALAGNDIYFVTYNHHISKGELELMVMNDLTAPSRFRREDDGQHSYFSNMIEIEYGVTDQFASELMVEAFEEGTTGKAQLTGVRWENRYRLFHDDVPLNPMLYAEYEDLTPSTRYKMEVSGWTRPPYTDEASEPERERILESRLVLSQDFGPANIAFNWINESDMNESGRTAFGYAFGFRYDLNDGHYGRLDDPGASAFGEHHHSSHEEEHEAGGVTLGVELYGALGDARRFGLTASRQEHYVQPAVMFHLNEHVMLHIGVAMGLTKASDDLLRTAVAIEF